MLIFGGNMKVDLFIIFLEKIRGEGKGSNSPTSLANNSLTHSLTRQAFCGSLSLSLSLSCYVKFSPSPAPAAHLNYQTLPLSPPSTDGSNNQQLLFCTPKTIWGDID
ncbi:hypothetical protein CMV_000942 [Castanea mollissima]|uniref:Uncharacterized protein n=1 Tax=Castanea mollissima TaxID=60419 RepID=A0A8J4VYD7_9ROSI|nr:hypothetical protein CMV_000942 [Castanea mollissima]